MTLKEIKEAIENGETVYCGSNAYVVVKENNDYFIKCLFNNHKIGLTWADNVTLNDKEESFYI